MKIRSSSWRENVGLPWLYCRLAWTAAQMVVVRGLECGTLRNKSSGKFGSRRPVVQICGRRSFVPPGTQVQVSGYIFLPEVLTITQTRNIKLIRRCTKVHWTILSHSVVWLELWNSNWMSQLSDPIIISVYVKLSQVFSNVSMQNRFLWGFATAFHSVESVRF